MSLRRQLGDLYRLVMAPWGSRALRRMEREGLPGPLVRPLQFLFDAGVMEDDERELVARVESMRRDLARRDTSLRIAQGSTRTARWIAERSSIRPQWGAFLHLCARSAGAKTILELGGCAGISGCYLASSPACRTFVTIEGSADLAELARAHLATVAPEARVVNGLFDDVLGDLLPTMPPIDLAYIDGDHQREPTLRYFERLAPFLADAALVVLDDIRWSPGMWAAWTELARRPDGRCAVDTGRLGLCARDGGRPTPSQYDLSRYTGWFRVERR
ncbi:MAG: O-methyltransferase [Planctomycetota bacterium]|jgi:predicted O-methyltransferase YrrM